MTIPKGTAIFPFALIALLAVTCGCHGRAGDGQADNGIISQVPATPQTQAKFQAQLNNPRVSPRMKEMLQQHLQQSGAGSK